MIIDIHTHAFPDTLAEKAVSVLLKPVRERINASYNPATDGTIAGLIRHMDTTGVDKSVLQPVATKPSQVASLNAWAAAANGDRIVSFGGIYPTGSDYKQDIDDIVSLGLRGIKLHPEYQDFMVDAPEMLPVYDYALSRGLVLLFHAGYDPGFKPPFKSSPMQFANVLDAMRGGTIIAAHLGGHEQWDDVLRYLAGRDIYLDTSMGFEFFPHEVFLEIVKAHGAERLLFGTDSPWSEAASEITHLRALPLTEEQKALILGGNAARILRL